MGASPIVYSVLNEIGRRYLLETAKAEDGVWWFNRYSDGYIEQGGQISSNGDATFRIPFESVVLSISRTNNWGRAATVANQLGTSITSITLTSLLMEGVSGKTYWLATGY